MTNHSGAFWKPMTEDQKRAVYGAHIADAQKSKMQKKVSSLGDPRSVDPGGS